MKLTKENLRRIILEEAKKGKKPKKGTPKDKKEHGVDVANSEGEVAKQDAWAGGENISSDVDWMKAGKIKESQLRQIIRDSLLEAGCSPCAMKKAKSHKDHPGLSCDEAHAGMGHDDWLSHPAGDLGIEPVEDAWAGGDNLAAARHERPDIIEPYRAHRDAVGDMGIPCPDSYRSVGDRLISKPSKVIRMMKPVMDATGADCPASAAQALADIVHFISSNKYK
jgi:hypothetical protein